MLRSEKQEFVAELESIYKSSSSMIIVHYHGLTVSQITGLRRALRENSAGFRVVKNTLSKIAASNIGVDSISTLFVGPTAIAYANDPIIIAKIIVEFAKINEGLKIIGGIVNNQLLDANGTQELAKLPSLDELRGRIIGALQGSATKLVGILRAPSTQIARVVQAYASKG